MKLRIEQWMVVFGILFLAVVGFAMSGMVDAVEFGHTENKAFDGDVPSQIRLSQFYQKGSFSAPKDDNLAIYWLKKASRNGSKVAQSMLLNDYNIKKWRY